MNSAYLAIASVLVVAIAALMMDTLRNVTPMERFTAGNNYDIAQQVIKSYQTVLDRNPTEPELVEFQTRLQDDNQFDVSALENTLRETGEYRRLTRLQSESANPGLEGALTEAQVLYKLRGFYRAVVGVDPDEATLVFLRERYRRTRLDDEYIKALIVSIAGVSTVKTAAGISAAAGAAAARDAAASGDAGPPTVATDAGPPTVATDAGPAGPGTPQELMHHGSGHDPVFAGGRDADAMSALCAKLGVSADNLKNHIAAGKLSADALLGGRCPTNQNLPPDNVAQMLLQRQIDSSADASCRASMAMQSAELASAGYVIPPEQLRSWSVPQRRPPICIGNQGQVGPVNDQTALIGTPLDAAREMEGHLSNMTLL